MLYKRVGISLLLLFLTVVGIVIPVRASELPPNFIVSDDFGSSAGEDGRYFVEERDILPGKVFSRDIYIGNYTTRDEPISLQMIISPVNETYAAITKGKENLLAVTSVTLSLDDVILYQGKLNETNQPPIDLGTYKLGESALLKATFVVDSDVNSDNWREENSADFYWGFYVKNDGFPDNIPPPKRPNGLLPQTGEIGTWLLLIIGLIIILCNVGFNLYLDKQEQE